MYSIPTLAFEYHILYNIIQQPTSVSRNVLLEMYSTCAMSLRTFYIKSQTLYKFASKCTGLKLLLLIMRSAER